MSNEINRPASPALPLPPKEYSRRWSDEVHNVLRLFFNQLVTSYSKIISRDNGGRYLYFPYGKFSNRVDQNVNAVGVPQAMVFDTTVAGSGAVLSDSTKISIPLPGLYDVHYHGNLAKTTSGSAEIVVWFRKNGADIDWTAQARTVSGNGVSASIDLSLIVEMEAGDYVEVVLSSDNTEVFLHSVEAGASVPAIPSSRVDVTYVSNV